MKIKTRLNPALLALFAALVCAVVFAASLAKGDGSAGVAVASSPMNSSLAHGAAQGAAQSVLSPLDLNFSDPVLVRYGTGYDNRALIGASPINGAVTIAWANTPSNDGASVVACSNVSLNGPFDFCNVLKQGFTEVIGDASDQLGQRHIVYWAYVGSAVCDFHAIVDTSGNVVLNETIPGSCNADVPLKGGAVAVDNQNNVHVVLGRSGVGMGYWERTANGAWPVVYEPVSPLCCVGDWAIAVSSQGTVMVGYKSTGISGSGTDIYTAVRQSPGVWNLDDISAACCDTCPGNSSAYLPHLAADFQGGIRAVWADGRCAGSDTDIYYREWVPGTGWDNQPMVRVVHNSGGSYYPGITVDPAGEAYLTWSDTTSSPVGYFRIFFSHGHGTVFSNVQIPFQQWSGNAWQKESSIAYGAGSVHVVFSSVKLDPQKDNFYAMASVKVVATPTPVRPRCTDQQFKDVCPGDTFYTYITHLVNAGIISGYNSSPPCLNGLWVPCFLPNNNTTRGQMAKLVVLAANLPINTNGGPHFSDVAVGSTFYQYVETAYNAGVINGYTIGCPTTQPCFKPNNDVTRGQLSKMASLAFGLEISSVAQTFEDVAPASTFYTYVQELSSAGIINGYACGGPNEPCFPPNNRPYFRPGNNVTRGQTAKILDLLRVLTAPTPTPIPTKTNTPTATVTGTPPTATDTPEPTVTGTPPTATVTPGVATSATSVPSDTAIPNATGTSTANPTNTSVPTVTVTATGTTLAISR